jgi:predicted membrane protein (TIGR00267 family)
MDLRAWRRRIREYDEITNVGPIIRRYFVIGAFDGSLTVLGIIIGASAVGATEAHKALILSASIGASVALAVSSAVGAYEAERVEKKLDIRTIERAMLARLSEEHKEAFRFAALLSALVHGIAPLIAALLPILPFAFLDVRSATVAAIVVTLVILFVLGAYLGNLVRERLVVTGLRFVAAGLGTAVVLWFVGARPI